MNQRAVAGWIAGAFLCGECFAVDAMEERATQLASALGIPTNATAHTSTRHLFVASDMVRAGELQLKQKRIISSPTGQAIDVDILDMNGNVIAAGRVLECASFEMAHQALLKSLVLNSMGIESLIQKHELRTGEAGVFCVVEKTFDRTSRKYTSDPAIIHFVRGSTAVSLYPVGSDKDIWNPVKTLDAVLSGLSGTTPPGGIRVPH